MGEEDYGKDKGKGKGGWYDGFDKGKGKKGKDEWEKGKGWHSVLDDVFPFFNASSSASPAAAWQSTAVSGSSWHTASSSAPQYLRRLRKWARFWRLMCPTAWNQDRLLSSVFPLDRRCRWKCLRVPLG